MVRRATTWALVPVFAAAFFVAGCDEQEQGRVLRYEPGTYLGKEDSRLDQETLDELRQRARLQQGG